MKFAILALFACAALGVSFAVAGLKKAPSRQLRCKTADGHPITYEIDGLGAPNVAATARIGAKGENISVEIARLQLGEDHPFPWSGRFFDLFTGNYESNPAHRNWAGSDLSGGTRIWPGGIGDVNVICIDRIDCISEKHDIEYWLAVNFRAGCHVALRIRKKRLLFTVASLEAVNLQVVSEFLGFVSPAEQSLLEAISSKFSGGTGESGRID